MKNIFTLFFMMGSLCATATIRYAKPTTTGSGDGSSWANANSDINLLLRASSFGDELWVAQGTYYASLSPDSQDPETDRNTYFALVEDGVKLYGGFLGTETMLSERDFLLNKTIFYGGYLTILAGSTGPETVLDGFTITGGTAFDPRNVFFDPITLDGAAMNMGSSSMVVRNCIISNNSADGYGGAVYCFKSSPTFDHCSFINNGALCGGGAMTNVQSSPIISYCVFSGNGVISEYTSAINHLIRGGGAIYNNDHSSPIIENCVFYGNHYYNGGNSDGLTYGGVFDNNNSSTPVVNNCLFLNNGSASSGGVISNQANSQSSFTNCTFYNNSADMEGAVVVNQDISGVVIRNSILWGNTENGVAGTIVSNDASKSQISFSLVEGSGGSGAGWLSAIGADGGGNIDVNPLFTSLLDLDGTDNTFGTIDDGLALLPCSPAVNAGDNTSISTTDIAGAGRLFGGTVDMGAYELQQPVVGITVYQDADGDGYGNPAVSVQGCQSGYVNNNHDCDDGNAAINPITVWYKDADQDGYSDGNTLTVCVQPIGYRLASDLLYLAGDCDDSNADIHPLAIEIVGNCIDENCSGPSPRLYVNATAAPGGNGETWQCAIKELREAVAIANNNTAVKEIWVAKGIYKPTAGNDRTASFIINRGRFDILGGFAGTETMASQADPIANVTSISGDIGIAGNSEDNSYHLLRLTRPYFSGDFSISGFKFEKGNANATNDPLDENSQGGAVLAYVSNDNTTFSNCAFTENNASVSGGAIGLRRLNDYNYYIFNVTFNTCGFYSNTAPFGGAVESKNVNMIFNQAIFRENKATNGNGGAVYSTANQIGFTNAAFDKNSSSANGGAVYQELSRATYNQCVFNTNKAGANGGAIYQNGESTTVSSSTFFANAATVNGGAIMRDGTASLTSRSNIFWKNAKSNVITGSGADIAGSDLVVAAYNMLQAGTDIPADDGYNLVENQRGVNPLFLNEAKPSGVDDWMLWQTDGLQLSAASPAINTAAPGSSTPNDIQEKPRLQCGANDKGAYEYQGCPALKLKPGAIVGVPIRKSLFATTDIKATVTNPFTNRLDIHYAGTEKASLNISDPTGKPMQKTMTIQPGLTSIYTGVWASGIYQVAIYTNGKPAVFKVIKAK